MTVTWRRVLTLSPQPQGSAGVKLDLPVLSVEAQPSLSPPPRGHLHPPSAGQKQGGAQETPRAGATGVKAPSNTHPRRWSWSCSSKVVALARTTFGKLSGWPTPSRAWGTQTRSQSLARSSG